MATQSLYRRFRPRKFSELYGQDHVVRALRNAVINEREGQAYLFSGPRGTGKTTTARILAKVLNCAQPVDGEPCCVCESCKAIDLGTSYDVLELDAASNNGVQEIRDIIEAAALTSPGRHRVFILDEVHMLTRGAEAALLKTLEEPPDQVVFVLATTDPQKVSETIRSRVQHLQFHLLPIDQLEKYVRHVISEAGLTVDEESIELVLRQGGGSARDTLSALELIVSGGADTTDDIRTEEIVRAIIARDHGAALASVARVIQQGRDAHTYAQDIVRIMRDCFLSLMSPELVQLPPQQMAEIVGYAKDLGVQRIVRIMETLGTTMVEMRHAPDARLLLEVAVVQLASPILDDSIDNVLARVQQLEEAVKTLRENAVAAALQPAPVNLATGRAQIGGRASVGSAITAPIARPPEDSITASQNDDTPVSPSVVATDPVVNTELVAEPKSNATSLDPSQAWPQITDSMRGIAKALFKPAMVESVDGKKVIVRLPNNTPIKRAQEHIKTLTDAMKEVCGSVYAVTFVQADPTAPGGMSRPVIKPEKTTIVDEVAADPFAAVDPDEFIEDVEATNSLLDALMTEFPGGSIQNIAPVVDVTPPTKSSRGKK